jgi:hypothetical protein
MSRLSSVAGTASLLAVLFLAAGCDGTVIRLGDEPSGTVDGDAAAGPAGADGRGEPDGGVTCPHALVKAGEVLWIGDSWITIPGTQRTRVRDLARAAGAIGPDEDYVSLAAPATTFAAIANQYNTREAGATKVKVLLMTGGGWDTIMAGGSNASVTSVVEAFKQHLAKVASDGTVQHVIYFLYPELTTIPRVADLRLGLEPACAQSLVACHFLDLQPLWVGHPEYTSVPDGIQASEAGAKVMAEQIWAIMQRNCIAQ